MSVSFDWDFSGESAASGRPGGVTPPPGWRGRWQRRVILVLILLVLVGLPVGVWVVNSLRVAKKHEFALRAAIELELKMLSDGDAELFLSRQDPADLAWQEQQVARFFSSDAAQFAPAPGLMPCERPLEIKEVHFFGHMGRAELIRWFQSTRSEGVPPNQSARSEGVPDNVPTGRTNHLPFLVTWFYRQDEDGTWYHVAPADDYWGIPYSWYGTMLEIRATEVESRLIDPLADELARLILRACHWLDCPASDRYSLSFIDAPAPQVQRNWWALPSLYLTGMPQNERARVAWQRALKLWLIEVLAQEQIDDKSLTGRIVYRQLLARLQAELGLSEKAAGESVVPDLELLAQALRDREQGPLWSLWQAVPDPDDPQRTALLEAEVAALLLFIEHQVGAQQMFLLLPALNDYSRLSDALSDLYNLAPSDISSGWASHLSDLTGVSILSDVPFGVFEFPAGPLEPPPTLLPLLISPGDDIAFICDGQVWVADADGGNMAALTASGQRFINLHWSPDGRWLLAMWQPRPSSRLGALYLLATDGSGGRLLTDDPTMQALPLGWSPDGREVIYYTARVSRSGTGSTVQVWALELEAGESRQLPGLPVWSPNGEQLVYVEVSNQDSLGVAWLARGDWEDPRPIAVRTWLWPGEVWSPDGSKLALASVYDDASGRGVGNSAVVIYDPTTERSTPPFSAADLWEAVLSSSKKYVTDGTDPHSLTERPLDWLWVWGWSADGRRVLVGAQDERVSELGVAPMALAALSLEPSARVGSDRSDPPTPRVLAFGNGRLVNAAWSPADPDRLAFTWLPNGTGSGVSNLHLLDLNAGSVYSTTESWGGTWSPDGAWLAFGSQGRVTIVDSGGQERFNIEMPHSDWCYEFAWNPVADLALEE
jgi:Tol biopolymer transport system component